MLNYDRLTVKSDLTILSQVLGWLDRFYSQHLSGLNWSEYQLNCLKLAVTEGFTNAVRHAHEGLPPETTIDIELELSDNQIEIRIWDWGKPFNPDTLPAPKPGELKGGGYGWHLLRRLSDQAVYERRQNDQNCLRLVKYRLQEAKSG
jgi:serine/threonine-protein kinase RsbW